MRHRNTQAKFVGHRLEADFPRQAAVAVRAATIGFDQQVALLGIGVTPYGQPPRADGRGRKLGRIMRTANRDIPAIAADVVDAIGNRFTASLAGEVVHIDFADLLTPDPAGVSEVADQLLFLGIHTDHRPLLAQKRLAHPGNVADLLTPPGRRPARQPLAIDGPAVARAG